MLKVVYKILIVVESKKTLHSWLKMMGRAIEAASFFARQKRYSGKRHCRCCIPEE